MPWRVWVAILHRHLLALLLLSLLAFPRSVAVLGTVRVAHVDILPLRWRRLTTNNSDTMWLLALQMMRGSMPSNLFGIRIVTTLLLRHRGLARVSSMLVRVSFLRLARGVGI